jgi:hypothetical protein
MSLTLTIIDDTYSANDGTGRKTVYFTGSLTNPYTAAGESLTSTSVYFKTKFLGGHVTAVNPSVTSALAGVARTGTFRADTSSLTLHVLQFFQTGLSGTSSAGLWVDNTTANLSATTFTVAMYGY